jgi:cytochrome c
MQAAHTHHWAHRWLPILFLVALTVGLGLFWGAYRFPLHPVVPLKPDASAGDMPCVLVFTRTRGFRHASIPVGVATVQSIGKGKWVTEHTEDPARFTPEELKRYKAVVFLSTTGDVLPAPQQKAFEDYIEQGGGFAGVHAAADTEYDWPWFGQLVGAWFRDHTKVVPNDVHVERPQDVSVRGLPDPWRRDDEWYAFRTNPRGKVDVLASIDDKQTGDSNMGGDHPIAWKHAVGKGRSWYTAMGHTKESFADPLFQQHLVGGITWAAGMVNDDGTQANQ